MTSDRYCLVLVTVPSMDVAEALAGTAVDRGLAACCSIIPGVTSVYRWEGAVHRDVELQLLFKTRRTRYDALEALIREQHPYEVPEILMIPITQGSAPYLAWLGENTAGASPDTNTQG